MRKYQVTSGGGIVIFDPSVDLTAAVSFALTSARAGGRCWLKSRDTAIKRKDDESRFYSIEYRLVDGEILLCCSQSHWTIMPDSDPTTPAWMTQAVTVTRRILNPETIPGGTPCQQTA